MKKTFSVCIALMVTSIVFAQGPFAHYTFNGNANDVSGNGNDGTIVGDVTYSTDRFGNSNSAITLNGLDDHVLVTDSESQTISNELTITAYVNYSGSDQIHTIASKYANIEGRMEYHFSIENTGKLRFWWTSSGGVAGGGQDELFFGSAPVPTNSWQFIAVTFKDGAVRLWHNSIEDDVQNSSVSTIFNSSEPLSIGFTQENAGNDHPFDGSLDDVRLFNRALNSSEIDSIKNETRHDADLVAHYPFNGNANDESGNGHNFTHNDAGLTTDRFKIGDAAFVFNGTSDYAEAPLTDFDLTQSAFSLWAKRKSLSSRYENLLFLDEGAYQEIFYIHYNPAGQVQVKMMENNVASNIVYAQNAITDTLFHHIFVNVKGNTAGSVEIYIDGFLQTNGVINDQGQGDIPISRLTLSHYDAPFNGKIDDVTIWSRNLAETEIDSLYNLGGWGSDTTYIAGGTISQDSTWLKAESPFVVTGDVNISNGATLTIEPGVEVFFEPDRDDNNVDDFPFLSGIWVGEGRLIAEGTIEDSIYFSSNGINPQPGDWRGIYIMNQPDSSINSLKYVSIQDAWTGIGVDNQWLTVSHSHISNCEEDGVYLLSDRDPVPHITNCIIEKNGQSGIEIKRGGTVLNSTIRNNPDGIWFIDEWSTAAKRCSIAYNNFNDNGAALYLRRGPFCEFNNFLDTYSQTLQLEGPEDMSVQRNYWGSGGIEELAAGENPKNLSFIKDKYDDPNFGYANYLYWLDAPWPEGTPVIHTTPLTQVDENTVLYAKFDGADGQTLVDDSQYGNHGFIGNSGEVDSREPTRSDVSVSGKALYFQTSDDLARFPFGGFDYTQGTVSMMVYLLTENGDMPLISIDNTESWSQEGFHYMYRDNTFHHHTRHINSWTGEWNVPIDLETGEWNEIVFTWKDSNRKIFFNGELVGEDNSLIHGEVDPSYWIRIGDNPDGSIFHGYIDEVKISNIDRSVNYTPPSSTVAHWTFEEGSGTQTSDISGNGHTGILQRGATFTSEGLNGNGLLLDGFEDYMETHATGGLNSANPSFTAEAWFYPYSLNHNGWIFGRNNNWFVLIHSDGTMNYAINYNEQWNIPANVQTNKWQHVALTYDGSMMKFYFDGQLLHEVGYTEPIMQHSDPVVVGLDAINPSNFFHGILDDIRISNVALEPHEFLNSHLLVQKETLAHWTFDEGTGTVANDVSGNDRDGTLNNGAYWTTGLRGGAIGFDGIDDYINVYSDFLWDLQVGTVEVILKPDIIDSDNWFFAYAMDTGNGVSLCTDGSLSFQFGPTITRGTTPIHENTWYHVALTWDGNSVKSYINGIQESEYSNSGFPTQESHDLIFGAHSYFLDQYSFDGKIDEIRITRGVLEPHEFLTLEQTQPNSVTDIDGNVYQTVRIGDQVWMAENLKVTHYRNGEPIPERTSPSTWSSITEGAYCNYNNDAQYVATYGRLYNWYAINDVRKIAPEGWHVATEEDWQELETFLGMTQSEIDGEARWRGSDEGYRLKSTSGWEGDGNGTDEVGFTGLPGGVREQDGLFSALGFYAHLWSSSEEAGTTAWHRELHYQEPRIWRDDYSKNRGMSVRCVKNPPPKLEPKILSITDVNDPPDQGGWVNIKFARSALDDTLHVGGTYTVQRLDTEGWRAVQSLSAYAQPFYLTEARTLIDSSDVSDGMTQFRIIASIGDQVLISQPDSGYSVDNIYPAVPNDLLADVIEDRDVYLEWSQAVDQDFKYFRVYRGMSYDFELSDDLLVSEVVDNSFFDSLSEVGEYYYRVSAVDENGNESDGSDAISVMIVSVDSEMIPEEFSLDQNYPNPLIQ